MIPFDRQLWTAQECADYLGKSYSTFIKSIQYSEGFPKRCPIPGREPRWPAKAVSNWALGEFAHELPTEAVSTRE